MSPWSRLMMRRSCRLVVMRVSYSTEKECVACTHGRPGW